MSPLVMSTVSIWFASSSSQRRSPAFDTRTGSLFCGRAKRTISLLTLSACSRPFAGVGRGEDTATVEGDADGDAVGAADEGADGEAEVDGAADGETVALVLGEVDVPAAGDAVVVAA